jgi:Protein of unknown function (DUF2933)
METTNQLITTPATAGSSSCHGARQGSGSWLSRRRGMVLGGGAILTATAFALSRHWLTIAELTPLLFLLPCAVMMFMCMKGMNHGQQTSAAPVSGRADTPTST